MRARPRGHGSSGRAPAGSNWQRGRTRRSGALLPVLGNGHLGRAPTSPGRRDAAGRAVALPLVLGLRLGARLPLHVLWRVQPAAHQRANVVDGVAVAALRGTLVPPTRAWILQPERLLRLRVSRRHVARAGRRSHSDGEQDEDQRHHGAASSHVGQMGRSRPSRPSELGPRRRSSPRRRALDEHQASADEIPRVPERPTPTTLARYNEDREAPAGSTAAGGYPGDRGARAGDS